MELDGLDLEDVVVGEEMGDIDGRKFNIMVNKDRETAAAVVRRSITPDHGIVTKARRRR